MISGELEYISSKDALIRGKWQGVGLLGKILMRVRDNQKESNLPAEETDMNTYEATSDPVHSSSPI